MAKFWSVRVKAHVRHLLRIIAALLFLVIAPVFAQPSVLAPVKVPAKGEAAINHALVTITDNTARPISGWKQARLPKKDFFKPATSTNSKKLVMWVSFPLMIEPVTGPAQEQRLALLTDYASERFIVYANGQEIFRNYANPARQRFASYTPWLAPLPLDRLRPGINRIDIRLETETYWTLGLGRVWVGSEADLRLRQDRLALWQIDGPAAINAIVATLTLAALLLWYKRRHESVFGWLFALGVVWWIRNLHYGMIDPPINPWLFWEVAINCIFLITALFFAFTATFLNMANRSFWIRISLGVSVFAILLRYVLIAMEWPDLLSFLIMFPLTGSIIFGFARSARRRPTPENFAMLAAATFAIAGTTHDFAMLAGLTDGVGFHLQPYACLIVFVAFGYSLGRRVLRDMETVEQVNVVLADRVRLATDELTRSEDARRKIEVEQAVNLERERIMREVHDGVGASLVTTLAAARQQKYPPQTIRTLRKALADLKLAVDSLEPVDGDLVALLATFRHRLEPDLRETGISILWQVEPCPPLPWLDPQTALHILRIIQEAISNVITHSGARVLSIGCRPLTLAGREGLMTSIGDDGVGVSADFEPQRGHGIANMEARAVALDARFGFNAQPGAGSIVTLWLPLLRN